MSQFTDRFGLGLSTTSSAVRDAYVAGCDCVFSAEVGAVTAFTRAIEAEPDFAPAHAGLARAHFSVGEVAPAREAAARARATIATATTRERSHVNALCLAIEGKPVDALAATRAHLAEHPRDAMVAAPVTGVFGLIGFSGRQGREPELVEFLDTIRPQLAEDWWFQSVYAFALNENGRPQEARPWIERSLATRPTSAHGVHIKAHVLYELGLDGDALAMLDAWMPGYAREGLMHCHLSWHQAISALALGDPARAWHLYERQVHPGGSWGPLLNTLTDSAAFLWRSELAGETRRGELWQGVRDCALKSFPKAGLGFADAHSALAYVAAGDEGNFSRLVAESKERVAAGRYPVGSVVPALAEGFAAFEKRDWSRAIAVLSGALAETVRIGGSRAQRDLVEVTLIAAYLKAGRNEDARRVIARRLDRRPSAAMAGAA
ncbi:MAG: tetratricopeptide repeat protein [Alphaproteobacteria bacterium]|nr:tetratricopeptide repeat protein [Alphaproteobacteria bacterium]